MPCKNCSTSHFSIDHGNNGGFDLHAGRHADVEHLMVEAGVDNGLGEEQKRVEVTFPDFRITLSERYQRSAHNNITLTAQQEQVRCSLFYLHH